MKYLAVIFLLSLMPLESFSQVVVRNQSSKDVTTFVEEGLKELKINKVCVVVKDLTPKIKNKYQRSFSPDINAITFEISENYYEIRLGNSVELSTEVLLAHELIHVEQIYKGKRVTEQEAYARQVLVSQRIQERIGK